MQKRIFYICHNGSVAGVIDENHSNGFHVAYSRPIV